MKQTLLVLVVVNVVDIFFNTNFLINKEHHNDLIQLINAKHNILINRKN